jgi:uncharacterized protein
LKWSVWNDLIDVDNDDIVIFNTLSHNAVLLNKEEFTELSDFDKSNLPILYGLGIVVDAKKDEKKEWDILYSKGKDDLSYIDLTILLTQDCQMRCVYCFEGAKGNRTITASTVQKIISFLQTKIEACKRIRVTWFGGEPLLAYKKLKDLSVALINFCEENQIKYSADIVTNGLALNRQRCEELISYLKVKRYIITVDGLDDIQEHRRPLLSQERYFPILWRNLELLVELGAFVTVRMTIDKKNIAHIPALLHRIANSKLNRHVGLAFCRTIDCNYTPTDISPYLYSDTEFIDVEWQLIKYAHTLGLWEYQFPHAAPLGGCLRKGDIVIGVDGEIYKCLDTVGNPKWITGNIGLPEDANHIVPKWYKMWNKWTPLKNDICKECVLVPLCNGGCPHNALFTDKLHGTQTGCPDWKPNYKRQIIELINEKEYGKTI